MVIPGWVFWVIVVAGAVVFCFVAIVTVRDDLVEQHPRLTNFARMAGGTWVIFSFLLLCAQKWFAVKRRRKKDP
jgi:hypothetical protein